MTERHDRPDAPLSTLGRLRALLIARLGQQGVEIIEEHPDHLVVVIGGQQHSIYLTNLARALDLGAHVQTGSATAAPTQEQLLEAVDDWLTTHLRQIPTSESIETACRNLDDVRTVLLPRVVPPTSAGQPGQRWSRPLCDDLLELALVIDQPDTVTFATPQMVAGWSAGGGGAEHAEAIALSNLRRMASPDDFKAIGDVGQIRMCATSDSYASSRALVAEELLGADPARGVLVALPSRDLLFVEPLTRESMQDIAYLALLARKSVAELPYPLSGEVFWVRDGQWQHIPIRIAGGQMDVDSPEDFAQVLAELMGEEEK